jgi:hypothetical protein
MIGAGVDVAAAPCYGPRGAMSPVSAGDLVEQLARHRPLLSGARSAEITGSLAGSRISLIALTPLVVRVVSGGRGRDRAAVQIAVQLVQLPPGDDEQGAAHDQDDADDHGER